jgi:Pentapeptide repeats (8 copies)
MRIKPGMSNARRTLFRKRFPLDRRFLILLVVLTIAVGVTLPLGVQAVIRLSNYPAEQAALLRQRLPVDDPQFRFQMERDLLLYETDGRIKIWTTVVQAIGGTALLLGLLFTWRNLRATQTKLDIDRQGQLTTRFISAAGQLGADRNGCPNVEVRLGGIYALDRIARDWPSDYWPIMEVLTAYVRHNAPRIDVSRTCSPTPGASVELKPRTDIQAILTILGRTPPPERKLSISAASEARPPEAGEDAHLDLRRTDLRGGEFWDGHFERTDFWGADLEVARFWGAHLDGAKLEKANLRGANLRGTSWDKAILTDAILIDADLREADLSGAIDLTADQVRSALMHGQGATLPTNLQGRAG